VQLTASLVDGEVPFDGWPLEIALPLPSGNLASCGVDVGEASRQALAGEHRQLALRHVEPTAVLRRVMEVELSRDPSRFSGCERDVERPLDVHVEVVHTTRMTVASGYASSTSHFIW
jgi:hypothetical protein